MDSLSMRISFQRIHSMMYTTLVFIFCLGCLVQCDQSNNIFGGNPSGLFEGDIQLDPEQKLFVKEAIKQGKSIAETKTPTFAASSTAFPRWTNRIVPYTIASSLWSNTAARNAIKSAMQEWESKTCIRFKQRTNEMNYLEFFRGSGCWGHVGMANGKSQISVGPNCEYRHVMTHEIGHAVGFWHEQSRGDRDQYIQILWQNVPPALYEAFAKYGRDKVNSLGVPYDYGSIMHYPWNAFSTNGRDTVRPLKPVPRLPYQTLSDSDAKQANIMYKCPGTVVTPNPPTAGPCKKKTTSNCKDSNARCIDWWKRGECQRNPAFMLVYCKKSCGVCPAASACKDDSSSCPSWANQGYCTSNSIYMLKSCRKSCKVCTDTSTTDCTTPMPPTVATTPKKTTQSTTSAPTTVVPTTKPNPGCVPLPAGLEDKSIADAQMTASSSYKWHGPEEARLNLQRSATGNGAWCSATDDANQFIIVDLGKEKTIGKIATQGWDNKFPSYVKSYMVSLSLDGTIYTPYKSPHSGNPVDFQANYDTSTVVTNTLPVATKARYVRIHPVTWHAGICLRMELFVC